MPYCYYTCDLLPLDLVVRAGYSPRWLGNHLRDASAPAPRDALSVHPMTCPFVTKLVAAAEEVLVVRNGASAAAGPVAAGASAATTPGAASASAVAGPGAAGAKADPDCLVVPAGCDAMRRLGDLLAATYPGRVSALQMPRSSEPGATARLAADLARLDGWLQDRLNGGYRPTGAAPAHAAAGAAGAAAGSAEHPTLDYPKPPRPGGVFVVSGPLSNDSLLGLIDRLGAHVSGLESCTSPDRWKSLAPGTTPGTTPGTGARPDATATPGSAPYYQALATRVLETGVCPRRSTADRSAYLNRRLDEARPASIIYARQSFCDPGAYDCLLVAQLARERGLPYLEIEVDFPFDANGPLRVRVEAFLEAQLLDDDLLSNDLPFEEL